MAGGSYGGYRVIKDTRADVFETSVHRVTAVVDGDTLDIEEHDTLPHRIRLLGIDAPAKGECYFAESKTALKKLLENQDIRIEKDISGVDRYDRLLRYVYLPSDSPEEDDLLVNHYLVGHGYARTLAIAPDNRYRDLLASAQEQARTKRKGMWGVACPYFEEHKSAASLREKSTQASDLSCTIKGNISEKGFGRLYFLEGCPNYSRIKIDDRKGESWFCSEKEARDAGFTRSQSCDNTF